MRIRGAGRFLGDWMAKFLHLAVYFYLFFIKFRHVTHPA